MLLGSFITVLSVFAALVLNTLLLRLGQLSKSKKRFIQRYYFIFLGLVFIATGVANHKERQMWDIFYVLQLGLGVVIVTVSILFPNKR